MSIDTKHATDRRSLRFETIAEMRHDLDLLQAAHARGTLRRTGNWTEGEIFAHLAAFINYGYEGYPKEVSPPWLIAVLLIRPMKNKYLNKGFPAGLRIPGTKQGTIGMEDVPLDVGIARLRAALDRLEQNDPPIHSPAFGKLNHADKIKMALRHGELHQSFLHP
jgi:hypothetical protein